MRKSTKLALAFTALAGLAGTAAFAGDRHAGRWHGMHGPRMDLQKADADNSGDVTFEEFAAAVKDRLGRADADGDGKVTVEELAAEIERQRTERMARRMIDRFDTDGDGALTAAEVEGRQKKLFALLDRNDDGKVEQKEMRRHGGMRQGLRDAQED